MSRVSVEMMRNALLQVPKEDPKRIEVKIEEVKKERKDSMVDTFEDLLECDVGLKKRKLESDVSTSLSRSNEVKRPEWKGAGARKKQRAQYSGGGAKAGREPEHAEFKIGLDGPLLDILQPGKKELNALQLQKFKDATKSLVEMKAHKLEPLTLYDTSQLYLLFASIAESWKNCGKTAWKKRIHKIKANARFRKQPKNNTLDAGEVAEIEELQERIANREKWENEEKAKIQALKKARKEAEQARLEDIMVKERGLEQQESSASAEQAC